MRETKRIITGFLIMLIGLMAVTACSTRNNPKAVSKAYISASSKMDFNKLAECNDYIKEYEEPEERKAAKAVFELAVSMMPKETKAELKTYKFKSYEKLNSKEVEITKEIKEDKKITITGIETGEIIMTYKKDGKGKMLEKSLSMTFIKVDGNWYTNTGSLITL